MRQIPLMSRILDRGRIRKDTGEKMMRNRLKLQQLSIRWKLTILTYFVVIFALLIGGIVLVGGIQQTEERELRKRLMNTARTVAEMNEVKQALDDQTKERARLQHAIEEIRIIQDADYIVVMDMDHVRLTHPVKTRIGQRSEGTDEEPAFAEHIYFSEAQGELGTAIRAFYPVKDEKFNQTGVVLVGRTLPSMADILGEMKQDILMILLLTLSFGLVGSFLLARHIKQQMFKLEPHEIVRMLEERTATFHSINEGVIAIDNQHMITIFNEKAKQIFSVTGDVVGRNIWDVLSDTRLPEIIDRAEPVYNEEIHMSGKRIMSSRIPIVMKKKIIGAVAIFQDRTEAAKLAEELTGVKNFVDGLRVQNHEHMNKLHTIAGLIQLGKADQALDLAFQTTEEQEHVTDFLHRVIQHDAVAGLLMSKIRRGKELGIKVEVDENSSLRDFPERLDQHDMTKLLGNLIENAFAAYDTVERDTKLISISIDQTEDVLAILIEDYGSGIEEDMIPHIFDKGFTHGKEGGTGYGLYIVKTIIDKGMGNVEVTSSIGIGTTFSIEFPMTIEERDR
ncbi:sensor histidine kinase [Bacillus altitudinis]|nr:sensor histidine kinase [Bacillus altitudinis]MBW3701937.1 sensor histidine kinase [Bacillus aerophilus]MXP82219.1 GHKL domain-containing protein [Bacillus sp. AN2]RFB43786.1 sensor histidine kinase [Bacillus sp. HMG]TFW46605.1 sensor histidine kinase [Bacillus sp. 005/A4HT-01/001]TYO50030.1 sensor histidine kinase [Bacillus sp. Y3]HCO80526.1 sensor histidine kinase [Bacillus sp. (in: firmicutes)]